MDSPDTTPPAAAPPAGERADLLESLAQARFFLRFPLRDLTDEQAALTPTASALCLGGLVKHVTRTERAWARFMAGDPAGLGVSGAQSDWTEHANSFLMLPGESVQGLLAAYDEVAARTDELVGTLDLDTAHPLPPAPWFEPGAHWSVRRVVLHLVAETAQHAGHADILRESIDGAKSMG